MIFFIITVKLHLDELPNCSFVCLFFAFRKVKPRMLDVHNPGPEMQGQPIENGFLFIMARPSLSSVQNTILIGKKSKEAFTSNTHNILYSWHCIKY